MDEMTKRQKLFCVISKETYGEHGLHSIQTNSGWSANPYGDEYAVVPSDMVDAILETGGYCDVTYTEDGKEVASFVAREKPAPKPIPEPEPIEPAPSVWDELDAAYQEGVDSV